MKTLQFLQIAVKALRVNLLRSVLTILGIVIGVGAVISMVAIGDGAQDNIDRQLRSLGSNLLMLQPGSQRSGGVQLSAGTRHTLTEMDAAAIVGEIPNILTASPVITGGVQIVNGNRNWSTLVAGTMPDYLAAREWVIERGTAFNMNDQNSAQKVTVIGSTVAQQLFEGGNSVGQMVRIGNTPFTVIGVLQSKGQSPSGRDQDDFVFVPMSTAKQRLLGSKFQTNRKAVELIVIKVVNEDALPLVERLVRAQMRQRHRLSAGSEDDFIIRDLSAVAKAQSEAARTFNYLLAAIASISLVVGGISIMNTMLVSVTERTREIGIRMAVGARRSVIRNQFLTEALLLCVTGGAVGIALGVAAAWFVAGLTGWAVLITAKAVLIGLFFSAGVGLFFGIYPAIRASRLEPIKALRFE